MKLLKDSRESFLKAAYENFTTFQSSEMLINLLIGSKACNSVLELWYEMLSQEDVNRINHIVLNLYMRTCNKSIQITWRMDLEYGIGHVDYEGKKECIASKNSRKQVFKESSRRSVPVEISTSTALVSCDGLGGYDWSDQAEEGPNYALIAFSSSSPDLKVSNDSFCSKSCLKTIESLKSQNDQLLKDFKNFGLMVLGYKTGLKSVEKN
ncbi:hypothetical protein Tco_0400989 [Tanacetum coccineum]